MEDGVRGGHDGTNGSTVYVQQDVYRLPSLQYGTESNRLEHQAQGICELMGGRHYLSPVPKDASLLVDVGCGTGAASKSMSLQFPNAQVVGIDLSPVPSTEGVPPNVTFVQGNIFDLAGNDPRLQWGTADLAYSRFLVLGMKTADWPRYAALMARLVKPGGYVEFVDNVFKNYRFTDPNDVIGSREEVPLEFEQEWRKVAMDADGIDLDAGENLEKYLTDAGLEEIEVKMFPWPKSQYMVKEVPETALVGTLDQSEPVALLFRDSLKGRIADDKVQQYVKEATAYYKGSPPGFSLIYAARGRKPK